MTQETKFYVDQSGNYLGGFAGAQPPQGAVQVPGAPTTSSDVYDFTNHVWVPANIPNIDGFMQAALAAAMAQPPATPLNPVLYFEIVKLEYSLRKYSDNAAYIAGSWALLKGLVQAMGVSVQQCEMVEAIGAQYHIPLVP